MRDYVGKVHAGSLTNAPFGGWGIHEGLWKAYYSRFKDFAEMGFGKRFKYDDPDVKDVALGQKVQHNLSRFATYKQQTLTAELKALKYDKNGKLLSLPDFEKKAEKLLKRFNVTYLKTELNHATQATQMANKWREIERTAYLYPNLRYVTANDERVRDSHRPLHNIVRPINDPFWKTHYPPNGWGCRCKVVRTDAETIALPDDVKGNPKGFNQNVGLTGQIFDDEHPYFMVNKKERKALEWVNNKLEYNNIYEPSEFKKVQFDRNSGNYIVSHLKHGDHELKANLSVATDLIHQFSTILLPIVHGRKSPDALVNRDLTDFKYARTDNARSAIQKGVEEAKAQEVEAVFIRLTDKSHLNDTISGIRLALQEGRNKAIKIAHIILPNGEVFKVTREEIKQGSQWIEALKQQWQKP